MTQHVLECLKLTDKAGKADVVVVVGGTDFKCESRRPSEHCVGDFLRDLVLFALVHTPPSHSNALDYIRNRAPFGLSADLRQLAHRYRFSAATARSARCPRADPE